VKHDGGIASAAQLTGGTTDSGTTSAKDRATKVRLALHSPQVAPDSLPRTGLPRWSAHMATREELSNFLAGVERRAFKQALFAVRDEDAALDIVQEAMIKLAENYGDRPPPELPLLFTRILQNATNDHFRRQKVRNTWVSLFSSFGSGEDDDSDPLDTIEALEGTAQAESTADKVERSQTVAIIEEEISRLPARQREAFLLRYWEDYDVAETAAAMGCTEGSVKTHCSRATHALARALRARGLKL